MPRSDQSAFGTPTEADVAEAAGALGIPLSDDERADYRKLVADAVEGTDPVRHADGFDAGLEPDDLTGRSGRTPTDDPLNAWVTETEVPPTGDGSLDGVTVGLKDSIALAGVELTLGSSVMEGFVPTIDATVVHRLRAAGATVTGKLNMESFAWSGTGDTSDHGPVTNPRSDDHLAGGSSSGSGAAPAAGDCDVALGTDQAGSVRIPSSWCGLVGIKPTHGLVPYTGVVPLERSIDHVGPMAPSVALVAKTLSVVAGEDTTDGIRLDERQQTGVEPDDYAAATDDPVDGFSVGVLDEGFGWEFSEGVVDDAVRDAVDVLADEGVTVESVSVPRHRDGMAVWGAIATQGGARLLEEGGVGTNHTGWSWPALARAMGSLTDARARDLPPTVKRSLFAAAYLDAGFGVEPYAKARSVAMALQHDYDDALADHDALVLPTTVVRAFEKAPEMGLVESLRREVATIANTCPFNLTGHPALSVPCANPDGLPVGMMLVGAHGEESTLFALASAFEDAADWTDHD